MGRPLGDLPAVEVENGAGAADLAAALHDLGYRSAAVLGGPEGHRTGEARRAGFADRFAALGGSVTTETCAFTRDGGYEAMAAVLDRDERPRVVFAANDVMAVGAMAAARDAGVEVPGDIAVAGFDDIVTLRDVTPSLTTVRLPLVEIGQAATRLALAEEDTSGDTETHFRGEVVVRDSTPPLHEA
ncbi:hypothetical protein GCM10025865_06900 [Paraoerskovia sediminicola]|uniref:Transcriptional regulator LacI/GalR-like sensor domain-containing protein n=1 Tax=Paraoerskovia sediminicola TaxID=1138587 RepID=A0ABM8G069_9CELL|nr:hypothetical protein GCM10025865_06900 [Paraoerskovia sediminicola]